MKKVILIILCMLVGICVEALENDSRAKVEWINDVYYNYKSDGVIYWGQLGYIYVNNEISYCIDITEHINTTIYTSSDNIDINFNAVLAAYFGYGYIGSNVKDYMATQALVWEYMGFEDVYFTTQSKAMGSKINVSNNISKIRNLINEYNLTPDLNLNFNMYVGEMYNISDLNNVLEKFDIINDSNNIINKYLNDITFEAYDVGLNNFALNRKYEFYGNNKVYTASNSQKLLHVGSIDDIRKEYTYNVLGVELYIRILDKNSSFNDNLIGNIFELYDSNNNLINRFDVNTSEIYIDNLNLGNYTLKHVHVVDGYVKCDDININIYTTNNYVDVFIYPIVQKVNITKIYKNVLTNKEYFDSDVEFEVYNGTELIDICKTDEFGKCSVELEYNNYTFKQLNDNINKGLKVINIDKEYFNDEINIDIVDEICNAKIYIEILEDDEYMSNIIVNVNDYIYTSVDGVVVTDLLNEGKYIVYEDIMDDYEIIDPMEVNINSNSDVFVEDDTAYIKITINNKRKEIDMLEDDLNNMVIDNEDILEKIIYEDITEDIIENVDNVELVINENELQKLPNLGINKLIVWKRKYLF